MSKNSLNNSDSNEESCFNFDESYFEPEEIRDCNTKSNRDFSIELDRNFNDHQHEIISSTFDSSLACNFNFNESYFAPEEIRDSNTQSSDEIDENIINHHHQLISSTLDPLLACCQNLDESFIETEALRDNNTDFSGELDKNMIGNHHGIISSTLDSSLAGNFDLDKSFFPMEEIRDNIDCTLEMDKHIVDPQELISSTLDYSLPSFKPGFESTRNNLDSFRFRDSEFSLPEEVRDNPKEYEATKAQKLSSELKQYSTSLDHSLPLNTSLSNLSMNESIKISEEIIDPTRIMKDVPQPIKKLLKESDVYKDGKPDHNLLREHFIGEGRLDDALAMKLLKEGQNILKKEDNMLMLKLPLVIVGDIHGQFYDLLRIFEIGGPVCDNKYLFLGDYVDRGCFGIECFLYLMSLKICYPDNIFLLRGNHESRHVTQYFSFQKECIIKYSPLIYHQCMDTFDCLALAALVNESYFCVHGGLSPEIFQLEDIALLNRDQEVPSRGAICDLLWSDPHENYDTADNFFSHNPVRGCSYYYSYRAVCDFLKRNSLTSIIRAHEAQESGYKLHKDSHLKFPSLVTIFSAPNYCDVYNNKGAIILFTSKEEFHIKQFTETPHPYWLPEFENAFSWSLPFAAERVTHILLGILSICSNEELEEKKESPASKKSLKDYKNKIQTIGKAASFFKSVREKKEKELKLRDLSPTRKMFDSNLAGSIDHDLSFGEICRLEADQENLFNKSFNEDP